MNISSSPLLTWDRHCAAAALRQLRGDPDDRSFFGEGVAAHAALEAMAGAPRAPEKAARQSATALMMGQRVYKGTPEPPYRPDQVAAGLRLAVEWAEHVGQPRGRAEVGVAVDRDWRLVNWESPHYYGQLLDLIEAVEYEDDDGEILRVLRVVDYKSAWSVGPGAIESLQMRGALLLAEALARKEGCFDAVEVQIAGLRKRRWFPKEPRRLHLRMPLDAEKLQGYRDELTLAVGSLRKLTEKDPDTVASPGAGCMGCPFVTRCRPCEKAGLAGFIGGGLAGWTNLDEIAPNLLASEALAAEAIGKLKERAAAGAVPLPGGREAGFFPKEHAALTDDAIPLLAAVLGWNAREESLVRNLGLTATAVRSLFRELHRRENADHDKLKELRRSVMTTKIVAEWGVRRCADKTLPTPAAKEAE